MFSATIFTKKQWNKVKVIFIITKCHLTILKCHFCIPKEPFYDPKEPLYKSQLMLRKRLIGLNSFILPTFSRSWGFDYRLPSSRLTSSPQGFVIRAEGLCGFQIRSYITPGLTNCLPPSRLTSLNIGCTRHSQASLTLLSFARYFGIIQTILLLLSLLHRL